MRSATVTTKDNSKDQEGQRVQEALTPPSKPLPDINSEDEPGEFHSFDMDLPRLENHAYNAPKEPYEEEFTLLVQTAGKGEASNVDVELLNGNQQVRFIRLAVDQVHQVRVPKDAMKDMVIRGIVDNRYTFSFGLDLLTLFYTKELNAKLLAVSERNITLSLPPDWLDEDAPKYIFYFQNGSSVLEPSCRYELNELVNFLKRNPERGVIITGYTNAGGIGRAWKNIHDDFFKISDLTIRKDGHALELAMDRASIVQRYLIKQGIAPARIKLDANTSKRLFRSNLFEGRYNARAEVRIE
jgi:outer membrane protein OmpA-like peptidoglycan-associated protein